MHLRGAARRNPTPSLLQAAKHRTRQLNDGEEWGKRKWGPCYIVVLCERKKGSRGGGEGGERRGREEGSER